MNHTIWDGTVGPTTEMHNIYPGESRMTTDGMQLICDIITKFNIEVTIKYTVEKAPPTPVGSIWGSTGWSGFIINFGGVEHRSNYGFGPHDKETVMLKLAAMYPQKILTPEEMKKHIYKDALGEET
jgi:hypothetical protein